MNRIKTALAVLLVLTPFTASAGIIEYSYTGFDGGDGWTATGSILIDEADVAAGGNLSDDFLSWVFSWTDGASTFGLDSTDSELAGGFDIFFATTTTIDNVTICFVPVGNGCDTSSIPLILIGSDNDDWAASIGGEFITNNNTFATGEWGISTVSSVPEPGTLALVGLGLAGIGFAKRKKA